MRQLDLFSGIGGFALAGHWMSWETVAFVEIDPFCQLTLKYRFPNKPIYADIRKTDFTKFRGSVDIINGGFPCQTFSLAGKGRGGFTQDSDAMKKRMSHSRGVNLHEHIQRMIGQNFRLSHQYQLEMMGFPKDWCDIPMEQVAYLVKKKIKQESEKKE